MNTLQEEAMDEQQIQANAAAAEKLLMQPLPLAVAALQQAGPDAACLALQDALDGYAERPTDANARKIEASLQAVRHHARQQHRGQAPA
jgi:hypothetical protein